MAEKQRGRKRKGQTVPENSNEPAENQNSNAEGGGNGPPQEAQPKIPRGAKPKSAEHQAKIQTEVYPDIYDRNVPFGEYDKINISQKRLYLAIRHLLFEHFGIDKENKTAKDPAAFPCGFSPNDSDCDQNPQADFQVHTDDKIRFLSVFGQLRQGGNGDPSYGRMTRWDQMIIDHNNANRTRDEYASEASNVFPSGSIRFERQTDAQCGTWTPASSRMDPENPGQPLCENFGDEPNPDPSQADHPIGFRILIMPEFVSQFTAAVQRYNAHHDLYRQVFHGLRREGVGKRVNGHSSKTSIFATQLAAITDRLIVDGVSSDDPHIGLIVTTAISNFLESGGGAGDDGSHFSSFNIVLPDLDAGSHIEIIPDNLHAVRAIYYAANLEQLNLFSTVETVVQHAINGMLPVTRGVAIDRIYQWIKLAPRRINEVERRGLYARVLGLAQGSVNEPMPNREFNDLWLRFLATVSQKYREVSSTDRALVSMEQVHKAGRDLAVNLSLHGYGIAHPAAIELQNVVRDMLELLKEPEILNAYGVRDTWQLVDRVSSMYLGGSVNGVRYRTMAASGERIISWLADKATVLSSASAAGLRAVTFDTSNGTVRQVPTNDFQNLAEYAERWLAVTGTSDAIIERNSDPIDLESQPTVPMLSRENVMPRSIQQTLDQVGVSAPLPAIPQV